MPVKHAQLAKLTRPRLHAALERARLFKLLDKRQQHPIVWVSGPPGAGKTTLVASYLEARKARTFWYQIDAGDRDPAALFHYLTALAQQSKRRTRAPLPVLSADHLPDLAGFARRFFREWFAQAGVGAVFVLDNCHEAASESFHLIVREACNELPLAANLLALSRRAMPDELARDLANSRAHTIGWDDLRLTPTETRAIARLDHDAAARLHAQCDGWVAGLVLLRASGGARNVPVETTQSKESVFAYFANEVFSRSSPEAQKLLCATALFPHTTASMALSLTNIERSESILNTLYRQHYFVTRSTEGEVSYQYHDLFREFLLARLTQNCDAQALAALRAQAAQILEANGNIVEAVALLQQARNWGEVARLVRQHANNFIASGRWQTVLGWFAGMPERLLEGEPWLAQFRAECLVPVDINQARTTMDRARAEFVARQDDAGHARAVNNLSFLQYMLGETVEPHDQWMADLEAMIERRAEALSAPEALDTWTAYATMVLLRTGTGRFVETMQAWFLEKRSDQLPAGDLLATVWMLACVLEVWTTKEEGNATLIPKLAKIAQQDLSPIILGDVWRTLGYWHFWNANYQECLPVYEQSLACGKRYRIPGQIVVPNCYRAISLSQLRDFAGAQRALDDIASAVPKRGAIHDMYYKWAQAHVAFKRGDYAEALRLTEGLHTSQVISELVNEIRYASYLVEVARYDEALQALARSKAYAEGTIWRMMDALAVCVEVEVHLRIGKQAAALAALRAMLREAQVARKAALLTWVEHWLPRQLALALQESIEAQTARQLIRRFNVPADSPTNEVWPWPIAIRAFGELEIVVDGARVASKGKAQHKLLDLLRALIALGAANVSAEALTESLWPDTDGDVASGNLRTSVHRLRKLLGHDEAIVMHDNKLSLNDRLCWLDARAFEQLTVDLDANAGEQRLDQALRLYRGNLFDHHSQAWVLPLRDRLRARFQRACLKLVRLWEEKGAEQEAEALYHQCLERDPDAEPIYRQLMLYLSSRGRDAEALAVYRRCEAALWSSMGRKPARETTAVYESLLSQKPSPDRLPGR